MTERPHADATTPGSPTASPWLSLPSPRPHARLRLFCFPHAGSGVAQFRAWVDLLPTDVELCAVRLPGRENRLREPPFTDMDALLDALIEHVVPSMDRPFALFGHSMGAMVAFALALRLQQTGGRQASHLFVSGHRAPHLPDVEPPIHALAEAEFLLELQRRYGESSVALLHDPDLRAVLLPVLRADLELVENYPEAMRELLDCPVTALGGLDDPRATFAQLEGWAEHTRAAFAVRAFPGGHFYLQTARPQLVRVLGQRLAM